MISRICALNKTLASADNAKIYKAFNRMPNQADLQAVVNVVKYN